MKREICTVLLLLVALTASSQETTTSRRYNAFSGTLLFSFGAGSTFGRTDYSDLRPDIMGRGALEYIFPTSSAGALGIRGFMNGGYVSGNRPTSGTPHTIRTPFNNIGGGLSYTFSIRDAVYPYAFAGASYMWFTPRDADGNRLTGNPGGSYATNEVDYHAELGAHLPLSKAISFDFGFGLQLSPKDNWDAASGGGNNDYALQTVIGLSYSFFATGDEDHDGVKDDLDQCPHTPEGVKVDEFGCPLDADKDGVPDYLDKCPGTKAGMEVDKDGCETDADGDGVPNTLDKCPGTPPGVRVDASGCPDTDGDGVPDNIDKCSNTPAGVKVDDFGCPLDSDKDGVPDYLDRCENTPAGQQVDEHGCATEKEIVTKKILLSGDTNFEFDKARLLPPAYPVLDDLAESMRKNSDTRWRVEGHTDAIGSDTYNMMLSRSRAETVVQYLVAKGLDPGRFEVIPFGESRPVASNDTPEGRAMNRRVEIKLIEPVQ
jgi:outer membrane protein OmpA-like peptidoglycan-associated protein